MNTIARSAAMCLLLAFALGCDEQSATPTAAPPAPASGSPAAAPPPVAVAKADPEYALEVVTKESSPPQYEVTWSAKVPTGGWKMTTENVLVEESMTKMGARVYVILEEPAPGEVVTQAEETLTGRHDAGATKVDHAELSVKRRVRGTDPSAIGYYVVVKRAGK